MLAGIKCLANDASFEVNKAKHLTDITDTPKLKQVEQQQLVTRANAVEKTVLAVIQDTCFVAGTPILTPTGSRPIESFRIGDEVWARAENDVEAPLRRRIVEAVFELSAPVVEVHVGGKVIETTAKHPMFVDGVGWRPACELGAGDGLIGHDLQRTAVDKVVLTERKETVYNMRISDDHTYFVGHEDWGFTVWVHNTYKYEPHPLITDKYVIYEDLTDGTKRSVDGLFTEVEAKSLTQSYNDTLKVLDSLKGSPKLQVYHINGTSVAIDRKLLFDAVPGSPDGLPPYTGPTYGRLELDGQVFYIKSGEGLPGTALAVDPSIPTNARSWNHVEGHSASLMRQANVKSATLTINNPEGVCRPCAGNVRSLLPEGGVLNVRFPDGKGGYTTREIKARR
ncbi:MAG: Hint domain-containing protein [Planctomycetaceae bacterium]|nr:Hint domain-containing protein [Planctomycetales bacterium]MCB9938756.1 Hint domain-containing protein [Planctomycetaceae bacterium]